ncbi:hypothetical protein SESBI_24692 [Sesbania bispinosa]|nr:hypothetical protein SESBI_24692 [Sesbania bispinosa]
MGGNQEHHLRSTKEEDLVHRSTEKIKDDSSSVMDVEVTAVKDDNCQETVSKVSYKDKVMETNASFELQPAEIVRMVTQEIFPDMDLSKYSDQGEKEFNPNPTVNVELEESHIPQEEPVLNQNPVNSNIHNSREQGNMQTTSNDRPDTSIHEKKSQDDGDEALFGPWMLVKKLPRKKFKANVQQQGDSNINTEISQSQNQATASRFEVLQSAPETPNDLLPEKSSFPSNPRSNKQNFADPSKSKIVASRPQKNQPNSHKRSNPIQKEQQKKVEEKSCLESNTFRVGECGSRSTFI